jgi:hypothetical protein
MMSRPRILPFLGLAGFLLAGCAAPSTETLEMGEGKQEFEQYSTGGNYRFQWVSTGADSYRTILWRQGESLSDDRKDEKLVTGVVRSVFLEKFCKELKLPVTFADGSPSPMGEAGKWQASLRCAQPPPKPKPEKKKPKSGPKPVETATGDDKPKSEPAEKKETTSSSSSSSSESAKSRSVGDGPVTCTANAQGGFDCKPKR